MTNIESLIMPLIPLLTLGVIISFVVVMIATINDYCYKLKLRRILITHDVYSDTLKRNLDRILSLKCNIKKSYCYCDICIARSTAISVKSDFEKIENSIIESTKDINLVSLFDKEI